ncbi:Type II site-specific deoxyribonuclease [Thermovirga lienii DSM 17291]|jgi:type II restriction enzyme|uniref:Type-2 restriction enzyme n=1 Tax=Thermovirga lienii (strain ATCC BAA-1197 / DSM 17291 / Cas60314) TaxID=580340 RepID=G7V6T7_THELD|nr:type II restriction endonuclease [Thermovirga lienii]AER66046.1 Type II site-specific deoxyribonuclease [Thermovirga lienii DSM 17291]
MKKICEIAELSEDEFFSYFIKNLKVKITKWDYFVNWEKVIKNVKPIERELNLLNCLIGKEDFIREASELILEYPQVIKAIPKLLAIRENSIEILVDVTKFIYKAFDFTINKPNREKATDFARFLLDSGIGKFLKDREIKNLVDYVTGVEVGLDSNARKNRTGSLMESIVEVFVADACAVNNADYISQATASKIKNKWGINIQIDKSSRQIDFAINKNNKLYFIETNFYGGGGSKLKSTAGEYITMNQFWNKQGIEFLWITDGQGWVSTQLPLREYFNQADYLLNLDMLQKGYLNKILKKF